MTIGKQLVKQIIAENQPLFEASQMNITHWFNDEARTKEDYLLHFQGRLANEYMNMIGISEAVAKLPVDTSAEEMLLLTKQAQDEAVHFRLVKEVIEHIAGEEINTGEYLTREFERKANDKGAAALKAYEVDEDPVALAVYQLVAEGRAATSWACMSKIGAVDPFVADKYNKIAKDEKFHSKIGAMRLEKLADADPTVVDRALAMASKMRKDLYEIIIGNTCDTPAARELAATAYGW
jgi:hypothetical protein